MSMSAERKTARDRGEEPDRRTVGRQVATFYVVTLAISWVPWIALGIAQADLDSGVGSVVFVLAACGPSLAALTLRIHGHRRPTWFRTHASLRWPLVALLLAGLPAVVGAVATHLGNLDAIPHHASGTIADAGGPLGALAYTLISGPLSEEFGWRGYLQPRLRRFVRPVPAALLVGTAWAVWHLPLFFLAGTGQHDDDGLGNLPFFVLMLLALSFTIVFVSERLRGGVWAAIAAHASFNLTDALLPDPNHLARVLEVLVAIAIAVGCWRVWRGSDRARPAAT